MTKRTTGQIVADLLLATKEAGSGIGPTDLTVRARIPHSRLQRFTTALVGAGLLIRVEADKRHVYAITSKGRHYLEMHTQYHSMAESFGMEL